jgi:hypothetical protein
MREERLVEILETGSILHRQHMDDIMMLTRAIGALQRKLTRLEAEFEAHLEGHR